MKTRKGEYRAGRENAQKYVAEVGYECASAYYFSKVQYVHGYTPDLIRAYWEGYGEYLDKEGIRLLEEGTA